MKNLKKYIVVLAIVCAVIIIVQIISKYFGLNMNQGILIEIISVILALLVSLGIIDKEDTNEDDSFKEIQNQIEQDIKDNVDLEDASNNDTIKDTETDNQKDDT